jgi:hypothetical protein
LALAWHLFAGHFSAIVVPVFPWNPPSPLCLFLLLRWQKRFLWSAFPACHKARLGHFQVGDVSNSDRDADDLPVLKKTYTVYHYNYQRGTSEAVEDHIHQFEAVLNHVDGRDRTPAEGWSDLLFWGKFVGSDHSHKIVKPGCGWAHYPPNAVKDYDWANQRFVLSNIEDWHPDGSGKKIQINCDRWGGTSLRWFVYWMQNLPGQGSGLKYQSRPLRNWWVFIGDYDNARQNRWNLVLDR